jgi:hypothetical protein
MYTKLNQFSDLNWGWGLRNERMFWGNFFKKNKKFLQNIFPMVEREERKRFRICSSKTLETFKDKMLQCATFPPLSTHSMSQLYIFFDEIINYKCFQFTNSRIRINWGFFRRGLEELIIFLVFFVLFWILRISTHIYRFPTLIFR